MDIKIRPICENDFDDIVDACEKEGWQTFKLRRDDFAGAIKKSTLIVAYDGCNFAGFARAISDEHITTFLCELLVVEKYRNSGIGTMLVNHIRDIFPQTRVDLISDADGFYEKMKFIKVGTGLRLRRFEG